MEFEEILEELLKIKPVENGDFKKDAQKKKSKAVLISFRLALIKMSGAPDASLEMVRGGKVLSMVCKRDNSQTYSSWYKLTEN